MSKPGRKTKLTETTIAIVADLLVMGSSNKEACAAVGISEQTFYRWLREHVGFRLTVEKAYRSHLQQNSLARQQWEARHRFIDELEAAFSNQ